MVLERTGKELIEECQQGSPDAFRELFEIHKDTVYSVALRYTGDPAAAMDVAQDVFVKLYSTIGSFRGGSKFESWLYRLVVNSCFDQKRKLRRLIPLLDGFAQALPARDRSALDEVMLAERGTEVRAAVEGLPPDQRMVIVLRYTQGLSYEQIAEVLGCSMGTIASRLNRVHRVLERRLSHLAAGREVKLWGRKNG